MFHWLRRRPPPPPGGITVIKECLEGGAIVIIRSDTYNSGLDHFDRLFAHLRYDFPGLKRSMVRVVQYGGVNYKHTFGLEFHNAKWAVPTSYCRLTRTEMLL